MPVLESPMGLALIVCDTILEDKYTGKKSLIGLFDRVHAQKLPCVHPSIAVLVSLTSGRGKYPCEVVCKHTEGDVAFRAEGSIELRDPAQVVDLVFQFKGVRFSKPGTYWLHFLTDGMLIMMRRVSVHSGKKQES